MKYLIVVISMLFSLQSVEAKVTDDNIFTLYRNNDMNPKIRIHVGTFDSNNGASYNSFHCEKVVQFWNKDAKSRTSKELHWCEKGYFKE